MARALSAARPSLAFSVTPTLRGESPSATPSNWVKYIILTLVLMPNSFSARTWCISSPA